MKKRSRQIFNLLRWIWLEFGCSALLLIQSPKIFTNCKSACAFILFYKKLDIQAIIIKFDISEVFSAAAGFAVTVANILFASSTASSFADGGIRATYSPAARSLRFKTWFFLEKFKFLVKIKKGDV